MSDKATKVKKLRLEKGMSQTQLREKTGLAISSISEIENGVIKDYSTVTLYKLCKALGKSPDDILDWEERVK